MAGSPSFGLVVEYVKDVEASKRFYVDVLGLRVERSHPTFVQFDHFAIAGDEPMARGAEQEIYRLVEDAQRAIEELSRSAEVVLPLGEQPFGKVFGVRDPDGRPRYLLELAATRPSRLEG